MVLLEIFYVIFFSLYPVTLSIVYGLHIEIVIFFLHLLYPIFVTLPLFLHYFNILCIIYLTVETYQRHFFLRINEISRIILYEECIICYETKFRVFQFNCCRCVKICQQCFEKIDKCPICKKDLFFLLT